MCKSFDFCFECGWNDVDSGCVCPPNEEFIHCPLYMHLNSEYIEDFEKSFIDFSKRNDECTK